MVLQVTLRRFFEFAAFLSETFVFAYLGLQVGFPAHKVLKIALACMCIYLTGPLACVCIYLACPGH